jgi:hypothetical protein
VGGATPTTSAKVQKGGRATTAMNVEVHEGGGATLARSSEVCGWGEAEHGGTGGCRRNVCGPRALAWTHTRPGRATDLERSVGRWISRVFHFFVDLNHACLMLFFFSLVQDIMVRHLRFLHRYPRKSN